jgi:pyruvate/2-oxoglutarate dehydrogenase complex dihydrolipoamide dehydrogenase (E3) component
MRGRYDLVVLGGGTAGLVSSIIAANMTAKVALIEPERPGGDCLWTGCVPSKSLIAAAGLAHRMRNAESVGLRGVEPEIDFGEVMDRVHAAIQALDPHSSPERLRKEGVELIKGRGKFLDSRTLDVEGRKLAFRSAIIATGSDPALPPVEGLEGDDVSTTDTIWQIRTLPRRLVVLGGGPIGCELGQAFRRLGSDVALVEVDKRLLGKEEPGASALIESTLKEDGVEVHLQSKAVEVRRNGAGDPELMIEGPDGEQAVPFDRILVAAGRRPRTDGMGLAAAGVRVAEGGAVIADDRLRTSTPGIFAAGDVTAKLPFTHVAANHGRVAAPNALLGTRRKVDETVPWVTFTDPEVGRIGLTEAQARERWGSRAVVARADYADLDRAVTEGDARGFALLIGDNRRRLVGATVAAPGGGEAIAELTARVKAGDKIDSLSTTVHAYPTLAEGPSRAADEHLRERYAGTGCRIAARVALGVRRLIARG